MKNLKFVFALMLFMGMTLTAFAFQEGGIELGDPTSLVAWLSPLIVWGVTAIARPLLKLPGWVTLSIAVPLLGFALTYFTTGLDADSGWIMQFGYTLTATFIQELKKKLQPTT